MRDVNQPESERRWGLQDLLDELELALTPYESSSWKTVNRKGETVYVNDVQFVIVNKEDA